MKKPFALRKFQRDDLARLALYPGAILGWATGLGKTIAMFLWPLLQVGYLRPARGNRLIPAQPVLLVVPGDGHDQTDEDSRQHFKTVATRLDSQATFLRLSALDPVTGRRTLPPGYYLTSYTQLSTNGAGAPPPETPPAYQRGVGETRGGIKCVYAATLADYCAHSFTAIVVDEGTKIQGDETLISLGVRQIQAPHRLVMSATPIKNRFPQVFQLAHYACGGGAAPTARFPFGAGERATLAAEFQVRETRLAQRNSRRLTAQICNLPRAWKIFAPVILRRRKEDCGEEIVPKIRHVVRAPMGLHQAATYQYHLAAAYRDQRGRPAPGPRLMALRLAAANPASPLLRAVALPEGSPLAAAAYRSPYSYIPKIATTLELITGVLHRGEQALIGGAFADGLEALSARLTEAGLPHLLLDGRTSQRRRGELAQRFKRGCPRSQRAGLTPGHSEFPLTLAGVESMAELHSFPFVNNVILTSYSWALDKFEQFINRVHRLNSPWPVNLWSVLCEGSADRVLEASLHEKGEAADLVLDGQALGADAHEVNLSELLHQATSDFEHNTSYCDERDLEQSWPQLRARLGAAYAAWAVRPPAAGCALGLSPELRRLCPPPPMPLIGAPGRAPASGNQKSETGNHEDLPLWKARLQPKRRGQ